MKRTTSTLAVALTALAVTGCYNPNGTPDNTGTGVLAGGAFGAATGAIIGAAAHNAGAGAAIGALSGAALGGLIGHSADQQQEMRLRQQYPDTYARAQAGTPLSLADVKAMSRAQVSDDTIIAQIINSHTVYHLRATDIIDLQDSGVSKRVIDYIVNTPTTAAATMVATAPPPVPVEPMLASPRAGLYLVRGRVGVEWRMGLAGRLLGFAALSWVHLGGRLLGPRSARLGNARGPLGPPLRPPGGGQARPFLQHPQDPVNGHGRDQMLDSVPADKPCQCENGPVERFRRLGQEVEPHDPQQIRAARVARRKKNQEQADQDDGKVLRARIGPKISRPPPPPDRGRARDNQRPEQPQPGPHVNPFAGHGGQEGHKGQRHGQAVPRQRRVVRRPVIVTRSKTGQEGSQEKDGQRQALARLQEAAAALRRALFPKKPQPHHADNGERGVGQDVQAIGDSPDGPVINKLMVALRLAQRAQQQKDGRQRDARDQADPPVARKDAVHGAILLLVPPNFKL